MDIYARLSALEERIQMISDILMLEPFSPPIPAPTLSTENSDLGRLEWDPPALPIPPASFISLDEEELQDEVLIEGEVEQVKKERVRSSGLVVIPAELKSLILQPCNGKLYVNRTYVNRSSTMPAMTLHKICAYVISLISRADGNKYSIVGRAKSSASVVLMTFLFLQRPDYLREPGGHWDVPQPVFDGPASLNYYIQRYKLFIKQFYFYCCSGRVDSGVRLVERRVEVISDDELSQPHAHRNLLNKWKSIIMYN